MVAPKVAITLDRALLDLVDRWVSQKRYTNRSQAIRAALRAQAERWSRTRLAEELAKINPKEERALAEEWLAGDTWLES